MTTHAVVTLEIDSRTHVDLALPLNIPSHILANAIAQALEIDKEEKKNYTLAVKTEQGIVRVSPQSTLGDVSVLDGFKLQLINQKSIVAPPQSGRQARLEAETGQTFHLESNMLLIGRKDVKRGVVVDIDLAPLDSRKIISRKHATIEIQNGKWLLVDQKSVNGTWLNGHKLTAEEAYPLQDGDEIIFGINGVMLKFCSDK